MSDDQKAPPAGPPESFLRLRETVASRLRTVCEDWPEERFQMLVDSIAALTLKYQVGESPQYDRRATERLIDDLKELTRRVEDTHGE